MYRASECIDKLLVRINVVIIVIDILVDVK